ncbi:GAF domain-containing protein [Candidatus Chloroploca sp. Khr17]|uniref:GAF domain-containing protein n=1 Tax=Candidatus Chloroploca sp. Khr17 TaxID=2496869 RepID=UPI00101BDB5D|nr:GAF domain-containing protein [Candidatus Chloroploca sp. Khr17]
MTLFSPDELTFVERCQGYLERLVRAVDLAELDQYSADLFQALLPEHQSTVVWNDEQEATTSLTHATSSLSQHHVVTEPEHDRVVFALRATGHLLGSVTVTPGDLTPAQIAGIKLVTSVMALTHSTLTHPVPSALEQRKARLRPALERLRDAVTMEPLLHDLCALLRSVLPFRVVACLLRYRNSVWLEMSYINSGDVAEVPRLYWRLDAGLISAVITSKQSLYAEDYVTECQRRGIAPLTANSPTPIFAWMGAPLYSNKELFGAMITYSDVPDVRLSADDQALFAWVVTEMAGPIRSAQRYERAAEEARQRDALNRIARAINSSLDPDAVLRLIVERAPILLHAEESSLLLLDKQTGELVFRCVANPSGHQLVGQRIPPGQGIAGHVAATGQASIINDTRSDGRFYREFDSENGFTTRSILAVPLRGVDGIKGVIEVLNRRDNAPFTDYDRGLLEALADQAVIALENARRFASVDQALTERLYELDRSNARLYTILRASNVLRSARQLELLLPELATLLSKSSGFTSTTIFLTQRNDTGQSYLVQVARSGGGQAVVPEQIALEAFETMLCSAATRGRITYLVEGTPPPAPPEAPAPEDHAPQRQRWQANDRIWCKLFDHHGALLGALGFDDPEDGLRPDTVQVQILEILTNQVATAIENAELYAAQQVNLNRMLALNGLGQAINTSLRSPEQIYAFTTHGMQELSEARWARVFLFHATNQELQAKFHTGAQPVDQQRVLHLAQRAIATRRPQKQAHSEAEAREGILALPLPGTLKPAGAICMGYRQSVPEAAEIETLILFASQAARAVEHLHLLDVIRQGRDQLASIMASTREGMLLVNQQQQIAVANASFLHLAGTAAWSPGIETPEALDGMRLDALLALWQHNVEALPDEFDLLAQGMAAVARGDEPAAYGQLQNCIRGARFLEWSVLRVATSETVRYQASPGQLMSPHAILVTMRDTTAAKEAEELRSELTNMMVHDLRSPLTSIITSIDMVLRGRFHPGKPAIQHEILSISYDSAQKLLAMVTLLLDISRLEDGKMPLEYMTLAVADLVRRVLDQMHVIAETKEISFKLELDPQAQTLVGDDELIQRVFQNIIDNALKFSPSRSHITLQARRINGTELNLMKSVVPDDQAPQIDPTAAIEFAIRDTGTGIKLADQERIFSRFAQAGTRRKTGSGLGLAFCKLVVEAHGGQIWVESSPEQGSTFFFTLPTAAR